MTHYSTNILQKWLSQLIESETLPDLPILGSRLKIRLFRPEDEEKRQRWAKFHDPYLSKYNFQLRSSGVNLAAFQRLHDRLRLGIDDARGDLVGYLSLKPVASDPLAVELGICFAADQVGKGYGEEAMHLVLLWGEKSLGLNKVILEVDLVNSRAIRLYDRLGFVKISEYWKDEDFPDLRAYFRQHEIKPGFRLRGHRLEVLAWVMKWEKT